MLELLFLALLSPEAQDFFIQNPTHSFQQELSVLEPVASPQKDPNKRAPRFFENPDLAILSIDVKTGKELFAKDSDRRQPIASLTKLVTTLLILENYDLEEVVTVGLEATRAEGSRIDIYEYEQLSIRTLLEATLIASANDAAVALGIHHSGTEAAFAKEMQQWLKEKEIYSARMYNATGLDIMPNQESEVGVHENDPVILGNEMSARDVLKLARLALESDFIRKTVKQPHFFGTSVDEEFFHEKTTTNQLLGSFLNLKGLKTGYTHLAGQCFIALGETPQGHEVLTVVLGSLDRFGETKNLMSWIYDSYDWR